MENITKVRIAASLSALLGTTWIFGLFAVGKLTLTFQIIFCLFNSLQGLFIFTFYCARNKDAQNEWKQCVLRVAERYRRRWQVSPSEHSASGSDVCIKSYTINSIAFLSEIPVTISSSDNQMPLRESMPSYPTDAISSMNPAFEADAEETHFMNTATLKKLTTSNGSPDVEKSELASSSHIVTEQLKE